VQPPISLTDKYKPRTIEDLLLPPEHGLALSLQFLANPYPAAFLHHGKSGLGKTSLANIMAQAAAPHPLNIRRYAGPSFTSDVVCQIADAFATPSLYGGFYAVIINEADEIPRLSQIRLLDLMDRLVEHHLVLLLTSNDELPEFDARFRSRVKPQLFTAMGLAPLARDWLLNIADAEGIPISKNEAARIVKLSHNNLRACLQSLELLAAERKSGVIPAPVVPDTLTPKDTVPITSKLVADQRQIAGV
jgi:replication-associated recombination protein RarA